VVVMLEEASDVSTFLHANAKV